MVRASTDPAATTHHHHLVCRACGKTVEVDGPAVERWADKVSAEHGFTDVSHTLEIFGLCSRLLDLIPHRNRMVFETVRPGFP